MKIRFFIISSILILSLNSVCLSTVFASEMDILVRKLVEKGILTQEEAKEIKAEVKEESKKELCSERKTNIDAEKTSQPNWTDKIKIKGDVRFRTQGEWGKNLGTDAHNYWRNRVRARLAVEGKVNEEIFGGVRFVTGSDDPRSTNQTLGVDGFETGDARLDKYYIKWTPKIGEEFGETKIWLGKFDNPMKTSELLWDSDITPGGVAIQCVSSDFTLGEARTNFYSNLAMVWVDNFSTSERDPMLWMIQSGLRIDIAKEWNSVMDISSAYYDFSNIKNNPNWLLTTANGGAGTNTPIAGTSRYKYDYNLLDFVFNYDSKQLFDFKFGHGLYSDFIWNTDNGVKEDFAWQAGGYVGNKKLSNRGEWKLWGEYRYIKRDAMPDFVSDSDFYGFTSVGAANAGGTNTKGINGGIQYAILKNTILCAEYYLMEPIEVVPGTTDELYQILQIDVKIKF